MKNIRFVVTVKKLLLFLVLGLILYFPIFGHLDALPIRIWDEARLANNALEMSNDGDYIVTHFDGSPDMWNTKPPLMIWCQVGFIKLLGEDVLPIRLPAAISAFFVVVFLLWFFRRYLEKFWLGFIVAVVLVTLPGYITFHAVRSGDYDSMLTLFTTLYCLLFYLYLELGKVKYLYLFYVALTLALLTKGVNALFFIPALVVFVLLQKKFFGLLRSKHTYFGLLGMLIVVCGYYLLREMNNPGYLMAVWNNELGGRYLSTIEGHKASFLFFYNNFIATQPVIWYLLIPCGFLVGLFSINERIRRLSGFTLILSLTFFLVISTSETKCEWYDIPLYPFLALTIGLFIHHFFELITNSEPFNRNIRGPVLAYIFLFLVFIVPYQQILGSTFKPKERKDCEYLYSLSNYLNDAVHGKRDVNHHFVVYEGYNGHILFYIKILNHKGIAVSFKNWNDLVVNDTVIFSQQSMKDSLSQHYRLELIKEENGVVECRVVDKNN